MLILALETSGELCSLCLAEDGREWSTLRFRHERRLSERLSPFLDTLLLDRGVTLRDIGALAVGLGPGSFTGVRVGVTMAKAFALALEKPLVGVQSLDALIQPYAALTVTGLVAVTPTRRTESVVACYQPGFTSPINPPEVVANVDIPNHSRRLLGTDTLTLCGENVEQLLREIGEHEGIRVVTASPSAAAVAYLAYPRLVAGERDDADALVPLYVTPTPVG